MKKYFLVFLIIATQLHSLNVLAATAFWCDAKEKNLAKISDVTEFKALTVKTILVQSDDTQQTVTYSQTPQGFLALDSKDVSKSDTISLVLQDDSGREYSVERFPDNNLRLIIQGSSLVTSSFTFLGISGKVSDQANDVIINCKSLL